MQGARIVVAGDNATCGQAGVHDNEARVEPGAVTGGEGVVASLGGGKGEVVQLVDGVIGAPGRGGDEEGHPRRGGVERVVAERKRGRSRTVGRTASNAAVARSSARLATASLAIASVGGELSEQDRRTAKSDARERRQEGPRIVHGVVHGVVRGVVHGGGVFKQVRRRDVAVARL
ncbi:MAG: hypothetical protein DWI09_12770 [Planctomycetota bacterium]|nr:MAG: hypothetical protein DWI09_12770 [Planctomycetota bacterium]